MAHEQTRVTKRRTLTDREKDAIRARPSRKGQALVRHGHFSAGRTPPEYAVWRGMKMRCLNPNHHAYKRYGGRGIKIHPEWISDFSAFVRDAGSRPGPKYTIDRIDNNGHYEPGNIRWTTRLIQARNRRNNVVVRVGGATMCISAAAELFGIPQQRLERRIRRGWGDEEAVLTPKLESSHRRLSKERRKNVSLSVKLAAALLTITREVEGRLIPVISYDEAKQMTAEQIIARFEFDHGIHHALGGPAEPWNLTPLPKAEHREKTNKIDRPLLAKVVRLERQRAGLPKRKRMIKKIPNRPNAWAKGRKLQSRSTFGRRDYE